MIQRDGLKGVVDRFSGLKIVILGDFLLDEFVFGEMARLSREAPVLILKYQSTRTVPGGGANTVANVESLGARAIPVGFVGHDEGADLLFSAWAPRLEKRYVFREPAFKTTRKCRILAGSFHSFRQQVVRLDYEYPCRLEPQHEAQLAEALEEAIPRSDAVIISDYSLGNVLPGLWRKALELARRAEKPIVVDSRDRPASFKGATSMTPNITEVEAALGRRIDAEELEVVGSQTRRDWELKALLITRGRLGMSLFARPGVTHIPVHGSDEVVDVTGAGDTVIATYTTALAAGGSFDQAARLANFAGGIVVMKRGTATVSQTELRRELEAVN